MRKVLGWFAVLGLALMALAACASQPLARPSSSPTPHSIPIPAGTTPASVAAATQPAGYTTAQQAADAGAHASGTVGCSDQFPGVQHMLVDTIGVFVYDTGACGPGGHSGMFVWVDRDSGGWHPYTWASTQSANMPTGDWGEDIPMDTGGGCVNVHMTPSVTAAVLACLGASDTVIPGGSSHSPWYPPVWADGHLWWYVFTQTGGTGSGSQGTPLGWVDLEYLVCGDGPHDLNQSCRS
jgi:hypothetical protein